LKNEIIDLTTDCYKNLEKAEVLVDVLHENYLHEKNATVILDIISANIKNAVKTLINIQNIVK